MTSKLQSKRPAKLVKQPSGQKLMEFAGFIEDDLQSSKIRNHLRQQYRG
jgi:hypothetical protein